MGFWDSVKDFWGSAKCSVNIHDWGSWSAKVPGNCTQSHTCTRCGKTAGEVNHDWPVWRYIEEGDCMQSRSCKHCSETENRMSHVWEEWRYAAPKSCDQIRFCHRCGRKEVHVATKGDHEMGEPERVSCSHLVRKCKRCVYSDDVYLVTSEYRHRFGPWKPEGFNDIRICLDCGHRERRHK